MTQDRSVFDALQALAPQRSDQDLTAARAMFDDLMEQEDKVRALPVPRTPRAVHRLRPRTLVASAALVAAGVIVGIALPFNSPQAPLPASFMGARPAAADELKQCGTHPDDSRRNLPESEWAAHPESESLRVGLNSMQVLDHPLLATWRPECTAQPVAVFFDGSNGAGLTVYRDVADPFSTASGLSTVAVRGTDGQVLTPPSGFHFLTWQESGVRWLVEAGGVSTSGLLDLVDALDLDPSGGFSPPEGFSSAQLPVLTDARTPGYVWSVQYGPGGVEEEQPDGGTKEVVLAGYAFVEARTPAMDPVEADLARRPGVQLVRFDGRNASYFPQEQGGAGLRWIEGSTTYRLVVAGADLDQLLQIARGLTPVGDDGTGVSR
ncbi:hypothetical protein ACIG47_11345 [Promicromonospora sp. NPDC052451]|uniref:hypothetical protein n=1 Tax=Promicromonospora sp. NPDC052451 TaxID=3364407 RepID=UPI0037C7CD55